MKSAIKQRSELTQRLVTVLSHIGKDTAIGIITAWIYIEELEKLVKFQERI